MATKSILLIYEETIFTPGQETYIKSTAENGYAVVFEDDEVTGYFYAVASNQKLTILDALHIYNVADLSDNNKPSQLKILWAEDLSKALLSLNNYYHALFDFENKAGYCRNGFPECNSGWAIVKDRLLDDEMIKKFFYRN